MASIATLCTGSQLYGLVVETSDLDIQTILMPEVDHLLGLERPKRVSGDRSVYIMHDFVHLLLKGSMQQFEMLYAEPFAIGTKFEWWWRLTDIADSFWCRKVTSAIRGYVNAEIDRITRHRRWRSGDVFPEETRQFAAHKQSGAWDALLEGGWDYDLKGAYHAVRLCIQADMYEQDGRLTFPLPEPHHSFLMDIRTGRYTYDEWHEHICSRRFDWDAPDVPNMEAIRRYLKRLHLEVLSEAD